MFALRGEKLQGQLEGRIVSRATDCLLAVLMEPYSGTLNLRKIAISEEPLTLNPKPKAGAVCAEAKQAKPSPNKVINPHRGPCNIGSC